MAFVPSSPLTGAAIASASFTTPSFTLVQDSNPEQNGKQVYVSASTGTSGSTAHTVARPFTLSMFRPKVLKTLAPVNLVTGQLRAVPMNTYKVITRKGLLPLAGQSFKTGWISTNLEIPAGAELADPINLAAMVSAHIGLLSQLADEIYTTTRTGTI